MKCMHAEASARIRSVAKLLRRGLHSLLSFLHSAAGLQSVGCACT
eukprot:SAG31_NODE_32242_length_358_cov_0.783784_1_plen_44_part_10